MGTVGVKWVESQLMVAVDSFGHPLITGSWPEKNPEWAGLKPSDLLLMSAASCSCYDVVMILTKQKEPLAGIEVTCSGEQMTEAPYAFIKMHLHYTVTGAGLNEKKVERAIRLSEEKYCSVINTLKGQVEITSDYELLG